MRRRTRYLLLLVLLAIGAAFVLRGRITAPSIAEGSYLLLELRGSYAEGPPPDLLGSLLHRREQTLMEVLNVIRTARADDRIKGMVVRVGHLDVGWAKIQDLRDALIEFKHARKPVLGLLEQEAGSSNREYYLLSVADRVYLSPNTTAPFNGLSARFAFLGGVWEKLDIQLDVEKIGDYKTAGDMLANKEMTAAQREMANWLLDSLSGQLIGGVAEARDLSSETVAQVIESSPVSPAEYQEARLSNGSKHLQDLQAEIGGEDTPLVRMEDYTQVSPETVGLDRGPKVGVVYAVGSITTGESRTGFDGDVLGADTVAKALSDAAKDSDVRAVVVRIDSPGGSALASDLIWRATQETRKRKPVIVSMSDVAGSGGYYIAAGATRIVAQPATLTGSIGVVLARPNVAGLLARLGINTEIITRGKFAALDSFTTPLTADERAKLVAELNLIYDVFVERVARGRNLTPEQVDAIGRGRVWTGAQARDIGLVDELGGFRAALRAAKEVSGVDVNEEVELVFYPRRKSVMQRLSEILSTRARAELPPVLRQALEGLPLPFEAGAVLTLMPQRVDIR
jgi:protease-4